MKYLLLLTSLLIPISAQAQEFTEVTKTIICVQKDLMIENIKGNGMVPLVGALGKTYNAETGTEETFYVLVYNQDEGNYSFVQFNKDRSACILGGGWNGLIFDFEEINKQLGWGQ